MRPDGRACRIGVGEGCRAARGELAAGVAAAGQHVVVGSVGERLIQRIVAAIVGARQPVEIIVTIRPVVRRQKPVDGGNPPGGIAGVDIVNDRNARSILRRNARHPETRWRIGEVRGHAIGIGDALGLAVELIGLGRDHARDGFDAVGAVVGPTRGVGSGGHGAGRVGLVEQRLAAIKGAGNRMRAGGVNRVLPRQYPAAIVAEFLRRVGIGGAG